VSTCPACGASYRSGTTVLLLTHRFGEGRVKEKRARVCPKCAAAGLTIVATHHLPKDMVQRAEARPAKEVLDRAMRQLRTLARAASGAEKAARNRGDTIVSTHQMGRSEGFEGALELLKSLVGVS
jgi:hypothetical protein